MSELSEIEKYESILFTSGSIFMLLYFISFFLGAYFYFSRGLIIFKKTKFGFYSFFNVFNLKKIYTKVLMSGINAETIQLILYGFSLLILFFHLLVWCIVAFKYSSYPSGSPYFKAHIELLEMNTCKSSSDCIFIYGSKNMNCYYPINSSYIEQATMTLKRTGEMTRYCHNLEIASGIICSKRKCSIGGSFMPEAVRW